MFIVLSFLACIASCKKSDMEYKDPKVSAVDELYGPVDNQQVSLSTQPNAQLLFQWAPSHAQDGQLVSYEVDFFADADSDQPLYRVVSDNSGKELYANISHININKACAAAGIPSGETGTIYWTVSSWRGLSSALCPVRNKLVVKRLEGFETIPENVYITGEATETGADLAKAIQMQSVSEGKFEIYTKLKAGADYQFVDRRTENPVTYFINSSNKLAESDNGEASKVSDEGIYRITIDFTNKGTSITGIEKMGVFFCPTNSIMLDLDYVGLGVWSGSTVIKFVDEGFLDERYKFQMETTDGTQQLGTKNDSDSPPSESSPDSYFYVTLLDQTSQWDHKWKFDHALNGQSATITLSLKGDAPYTHTVKKN